MFTALPETGVIAHEPERLIAAGTLSVPLILQRRYLACFLFQRSLYLNLCVFNSDEYFSIPDPEFQDGINQLYCDFVVHLLVDHVLIFAVRFDIQAS